MGLRAVKRCSRRLEKRSMDVCKSQVHRPVAGCFSRG